MSDRKVEIRREAGDVSPKVSVPSAVIALAAVVSGIATGDIDPEQIGLAIAAVINFVLGYLVTDKKEV